MNLSPGFFKRHADSREPIWWAFHCAAMIAFLVFFSVTNAEWYFQVLGGVMFVWFYELFRVSSSIETEDSEG